MRVLLIHQAFVGPHEAGGTRHFEFAQRLAKRGIEFTIVASSVNYLTGQRVSRPAVEQIEGVAVRRAYSPSLHHNYLWRALSFLIFTWCSFWTAVRQRNIDLVMGTSPPLPQALSAWAVAAVKRRPLLLEIRDLWPEFAIGLGLLKNPLLVWVARRIERFLYRRASHLVVNSPAYRDYLLKQGVPPAKISVIPNGVDASMFATGEPRSSAADELRRQLGLEEQFVVTYAGAVGIANDVDLLLEAAARTQRVPGIHWLLVGDGKERPRLQAAARDRGLDNLTFAGPRSKADMPRVLEASDACVATLKDIPMFRMTYPNKVFDYMAAGRATILAVEGVIRDVVEDAGGGLAVPQGDAPAIAQAALRLAADPPAARQMGDSAREYVADHFGRDRQARQFAELVSQLRAA